MNGRARRRTSWRWPRASAAASRVGACLATAEAAKGMTPGTHGSTFGGNPLAMAVGNAVIDIVSDPAFLEDVRRKGLYFKQRLASVVDTPSGCRRRDSRRGPAHRPALHHAGRRGRRGAARSTACWPSAPATTSLRLLPPLNVSDAEIDGAIERLDAALGGAGAGQGRGGVGCADGPPFPRSRRLRYGNAESHSRGGEPPEAPAPHAGPAEAVCRPDAGHDLRQAVDAHARLLRCRHARARRRDDHARPARRCSSPARRRSPIPRACCRAMSMPS